MSAKKRLFPMYEVRLHRTRGVKLDHVSKPCDVLQIAEAVMKGREREVFLTLFVDTGHNVRGGSIISIGTLDSAVVSMREIFKAAILANAAAIIAVHNHPSGDPSPSMQDRNITNEIVEAGKIIGIQLLDSVIIGEDGRYFSFTENGLMTLHESARKEITSNG